MSNPDLPIWIGAAHGTAPLALLPARAALAVLRRLGSPDAERELCRIAERGVGSYEWSTPRGRFVMEAA